MRPHRPALPVRYGSRDGSRDDAATPGSADHRCRLCQVVIPSPRARYCSDACKQRAYRLRQLDLTSVDLDVLAADLRRRQVLVAHTVYECPTCDTRYLGERRCPDCHVFCRRLGLGGTCPDCDAPILLTELLGPEVHPEQPR